MITVLIIYLIGWFITSCLYFKWATINYPGVIANLAIIAYAFLWFISLPLTIWDRYYTDYGK